MRTAYKHTLRICNIYWFCTAAAEGQMDGQTSLKTEEKFAWNYWYVASCVFCFSCRWETWETTHDGNYVWKVNKDCRSNGLEVRQKFLFSADCHEHGSKEIRYSVHSVFTQLSEHAFHYSFPFFLSFSSSFFFYLISFIILHLFSSFLSSFHLLHLLRLLHRLSLYQNFSLLPNTDPQTARNLFPIPTSKPLLQ